MNQSIDFFNKIIQLSEKEIPEKVILRAKRSLIDYISVVFAGYVFQKDKIDSYFLFLEPECGNCTAIGTGKRLAVKEAVFLNGLNGHALDYDDGTNAGIIHLGSPIFSLLLPLAERFDISLDKLLKAAVIGYEVSFTLAVSIQPGHKVLGYHATGTCGVVGATVAAGIMLDLTKEELFYAFAAACVSASGMLKVLDDGSELKPYNVAKTALLALTSLQLAKAGFKGHHDPLGGRGFFRMMTGSENVELTPMLLNGTYAIEKSYTKPYASCRYTHPAVEAAISIRNRYGFKPEDIKKIEIMTYSLAVGGHDSTKISGSYAAKMSTPYSVAAGIIFGKAGLNEFSEETVQSPEIKTLTEKISVMPDDELSEIFPAKQSAIVTVYTDCDKYTERVDFPKGEPENPLTDEEFRDRYDGLMQYAGVNIQKTDTIYHLIQNGTCKIREITAIIAD